MHDAPILLDYQYITDYISILANLPTLSYVSRQSIKGYNYQATVVWPDN